MQTEKISSDGSALVNPTQVWVKISPETPQGVKLLLINEHAGCATIGIYDKNESHFTHYAGLPAFQKGEVA